VVDGGVDAIRLDLHALGCRADQVAGAVLREGQRLEALARCGHAPCAREIRSARVEHRAQVRHVVVRDRRAQVFGVDIAGGHGPEARELAQEHGLAGGRAGKRRSLPGQRKFLQADLYVEQVGVDLSRQGCRDVRAVLGPVGGVVNAELVEQHERAGAEHRHQEQAEDDGLTQHPQATAHGAAPIVKWTDASSPAGLLVQISPPWRRIRRCTAANSTTVPSIWPTGRTKYAAQGAEPGGPRPAS
jgi:hypothetical protein